MKYWALALVMALVGATPLFGQSSFSAPKPNLPPGWIDGATSPNSVPDRVAYRLVFTNLMLPTSPVAQAATSRQENRIGKIQLSGAASYATWKATPNATKTAIFSIVQSTRALLQSQLSADGNSKLSAYVALEKRHMLVGPDN